MTQDDIERLISELRTEADAAHFPDLAEPAVARGSRRSWIGRLRTRTAAATASLVLAFGGLGGAAYAANGAVPGDLLYGVDRALEAVGIGNGASAERLEEVKTLVEQGHADHGLEHAANVVADPGAQAALFEAAERISGLDQAAAQEGVAPLLTYLSETVGPVDGPTVAELARAIGGNDTPGPPEGVTQGGPPESVTPGGPPEDVPRGGPPDNVPRKSPPTTTP